MEDLARKYRRWGIYFLISSLLITPSFFIFAILGALVGIGLLGMGGLHGGGMALGGLSGIAGFLLCLATASYFVYVFFTRIRKEIRNTPADDKLWALWHAGLFFYVLNWIAVPALLLGVVTFP